MLINRQEAELIAASVFDRDGIPSGLRREVSVEEFDLGFVLTDASLSQYGFGVGAGRVVVDRTSGEPTVWQSAPLHVVIQLYRLHREEQPAYRLTFDPLARARRLRLRAAFPDRVTELRLPGGRTRRAYTMKGDAEPQPHPIVRAFQDGLEVRLRERGYERCSEVEALSDELYAADARRLAAGRPPLTLAAVRDEVLRDAGIVTYAVRPKSDPAAGRPLPPCISCHMLLVHLGFMLQPPSTEGAR